MIRMALGIAIGAGATIAATFAPQIAPLYSAMIYDCGIRVRSDGGTLSGFHISGHRYGVCVEAGNISLKGNSFD